MKTGTDLKLWLGMQLIALACMFLLPVVSMIRALFR